MSGQCMEPKVSFFPTYQVRVFRFYVSWTASSSEQQPLDQSDPRRTSTASSGSECSPPDLHRKLRIRAFPAGPPPQAQDQSVPRRTSAASCGSKCSPTDPNRELRIRVFPAGPQPQRISEDIPDRMPEKNVRIDARIECQIECQVACQIACQNVCQNIWQTKYQIECQRTCQYRCHKGCQIGCQNRCQIECQNRMSENICHIYFQMRCQKLRHNMENTFLDLVTFLLDLDTFTGRYYNSFGDGYPSFGVTNPLRQ